VRWEKFRWVMMISVGHSECPSEAKPAAWLARSRAFQPQYGRFSFREVGLSLVILIACRRKLTRGEILRSAQNDIK
jgi:hypothetical protein